MAHLSLGTGLTEARPTVRTRPVSASTAAHCAELLSILQRELTPHGTRSEIHLRERTPSDGPIRPHETHHPTELHVFGPDQEQRATVLVADMTEGRFYCVTPRDAPWLRFPLHQTVEAAAYLRLLARDHTRLPAGAPENGPM
ncbi:hypothetical protein [Sphaerisporangium aureirubrum]|uniref:DUF5753 domain-containing protein n=1 Tax=Sphaerisporangium aureirubrum TaxID=1544736 RepID=A0ABW1NNC8_9ACTN